MVCGSETPVSLDLAENLSQLKNVMAQTQGEDLCISPCRSTLQALLPHLPWVTYMHMCVGHMWLQPRHVPVAEQHVHPTARPPRHAHGAQGVPGPKELIEATSSWGPWAKDMSYPNQGLDALALHRVVPATSLSLDQQHLPLKKKYVKPSLTYSYNKVLLICFLKLH
jgi:hypothetical protein